MKDTRETDKLWLWLFLLLVVVWVFWVRLIDITQQILSGQEQTQESLERLIIDTHNELYVECATK